MAGAVAWTLRGPATPATAAATAEPVATAPVERRTLAEMADLDGMLSFADPQPLQPGSQGIVTWLPAEASMLKRGSIAARIDDQPVIALYGRLPVYRQLRNGDEGRDVTQLERNLHALGYDADDELTVDDEFTAATARAVKRLEKAYGLEQDGIVDLDEVVYLPDGPAGRRARRSRSAPEPAASSTTRPRARVSCGSSSTPASGRSSGEARPSRSSCRTSGC